MNDLSPPVKYCVFAALLALMVATRFRHLGSFLHLSDASMAVFFLGGLYLRRHALFAVFLSLAVAIDFIGITARGLDFFQHYCVTPPYTFLLAAYAVLWYAGRAYAPRMAASGGAVTAGLGVALLAACASFLISNAAFYWLGGRYAQPHFAEYLARIWQWGPMFVRITMIYVAVAFLLHALIVRFAPPRASESARRV